MAYVWQDPMCPPQSWSQWTCLCPSAPHHATRGRLEFGPTAPTGPEAPNPVPIPLRTGPTRGAVFSCSSPILPRYTSATSSGAAPPRPGASPVPKGRVQTRPPTRATASSRQREPWPRSRRAAPSPASPAPTATTRRPPPSAIVPGTDRPGPALPRQAPPLPPRPGPAHSSQATPPSHRSPLPRAWEKRGASGDTRWGFSWWVNGFSEWDQAPGCRWRGGRGDTSWGGGHP